MNLNKKFENILIKDIAEPARAIIEKMISGYKTNREFDLITAPSQSLGGQMAVKCSVFYGVREYYKVDDGEKRWIDQWSVQTQIILSGDNLSTKIYTKTVGSRLGMHENTGWEEYFTDKPQKVIVDKIAKDFVTIADKLFKSFPNHNNIPGIEKYKAKF